VLATCGDVVTLEALAVAAILRARAPDLKLRFVNVVDLFKLHPITDHPHGPRSASSTACSRPTSRSSSTSTATRR
jgi:phosphoketolase